MCVFPNILSSCGLILNITYVLGCVCLTYLLCLFPFVSLSLCFLVFCVDLVHLLCLFCISYACSAYLFTVSVSVQDGLSLFSPVSVREQLHFPQGQIGCLAVHSSAAWEGWGDLGDHRNPGAEVSTYAHMHVYIWHVCTCMHYMSVCVLATDEWNLCRVNP